MSLLHRSGLTAALLLLATPAIAFDSGSTGADGDLSPSAPVEIQVPESGVLNYSSINIPAGVTVRFRRNATNTPVTLLVSGNATIAGTIDVSGKAGAPTAGAGDGNVADDGLPGEGGPGGFPGGAGGRPDTSTGASSLRQAQAGVGPGGGRAYTNLTQLWCNGSGGSFGSAGGNGCSSAPSTYGTADLLPLIGGSGGAGGTGSSNTPGGGGGGGGGALLLAVTGRLNITGAIRADGGAGADVAHNYNTEGVPGAGGSGGAIRLIATILEGNGALSIAGGRSGRWPNQDPGSGGGAGRLRIEAETCTRPGCPANQPGAIFVAGLPALRIASVAGIAAPAAPTGSADIVLPADTASTVAVVVEGRNIPLGNTATIIVTPARGNPTSVISSALVGSELSSTATASVSLGDGNSVLLATLSYSVSGAQQRALSAYTDGEKVMRVELAAGMGGKTETVLITESGRRVLM